MQRHRTIRGCQVPSFFYGTAWKEERTEELTTLALAAGFRGIDTANQRRHYYEVGVGDAVAAAVAGDLAREDLWLQTKFTYVRGQDHRLPYDANASFSTQVQQSFASSLEHLQTTYIDSYVLHGPWGRFALADADREVWRAMEQLHGDGKVKLLGVSNVSLDQLAALHGLADVKPAFVQNRCFAREGWDGQVRAFCRDHDIAYQGFSLLTANARELRSAAVHSIAEQHGRTLPQVVFRFAMQVEMLPLTGTTQDSHMREDLQSYDFELSDEEVETLLRV